MSLPDIPLREAILALAPPDDDRHAARIAAASDDAGQYAQIIGDYVFGNQVRIGRDMATMWRTVSRLLERIQALERLAVAQENTIQALKTELHHAR
jgi:hypothetical protein